MKPVDNPVRKPRPEPVSQAGGKRRDDVIEVKFTFSNDTEPEVCQGKTVWNAFGRSHQVHELHLDGLCIEGTLKELETIEKAIHAYAKEVNDGSSARESQSSQGAYAVQS